MRISQMAMALFTVLSLCGAVVKCTSTPSPTQHTSPVRTHTPVPTTTDVSYDDLTWPIVGHWVSTDSECTQACEFTITRVSNSMAKLVFTGDHHLDGYVVLRHERGTLWSADYKTQTNVFWLEEYNGLLADENGSVWHKA